MSRTIKMNFIWVGFVLVWISFCNAKVTPKISCEEDVMQVELSGANLLDAYLKGLKNYPEPACLPARLSGNVLRFRFSLKELFRCGTSQILNKVTGSITFYNRLVIIDREGKDSEILVKCKQEGLPNFTSEMADNHLNRTLRLRRDVLPAGFEEQEFPIFYADQKGEAPEPILSMVVKQDGRVIGQELLVTPGAPLTMEVSHIERKLQPNGPDDDVYGIIVSKLDVTDTQDQSEVILINGCSVDPYLFENFITSDGDTVVAKFRAFKFPDSSYVFFKGTVNVCLGTCQPSQCSNGQIGYGRRRRRSLKLESDYNGIYQAEVFSILRINNPTRHSDLEDGTVLYRPKRLNVNNYLLTSEDNGNMLIAEQRTSHATLSTLANIMLLACLGVLRLMS